MPQILGIQKTLASAKRPKKKDVIQNRLIMRVSGQPNLLK